MATSMVCTMAGNGTMDRNSVDCARVDFLPKTRPMIVIADMSGVVEASFEKKEADCSGAPSNTKSIAETQMP